MSRIKFNFSATFLLVISMAATAVAWIYANRYIHANSATRFEQWTTGVSSALGSRMQSYTASLLHTRALFMADSEMSQDRFKKYIDSLEIQKRYPGTLGLGLILRVPKNQVAFYEQKARAEGLLNYHIFPRQNQNEYFPVFYLEPGVQPQAPGDRSVMGFDMHSEALRAQAMDIARDRGEAQLSSKIYFSTQPAKTPKAGFFIFLPIYQPSTKARAENSEASNVDARQKALVGFVYSAFQAQDLFAESLGTNWVVDGHIDLQIFDGENNTQPEALLYSTLAENAEPYGHSAFSKTVSLNLAGHFWTLRYTAQPSFDPFWFRYAPVLVLLVGFLITAFWWALRIANSEAEFARGVAHLSREALAKSESQLRLVTDALPVLISYIDLNHRYLFVNEAYELWFKHPKAYFIGKSLRENIGDFPYDRIKGYLKMAFEGRRVVFESEMPYALGTRYVEATYTPDIDEQNKVRGLIILVNDITARKLDEEILHHTQEELQAQSEILATLNRLGRKISAELDLEKVVQSVTDVATQLTHAQFGAFFYNVVNPEGHAYTLYTVSGISRESFAQFPMPRATAVFAPTFLGVGVVRSDDITQDPRYGKNAPHFGMPKGHLPVVSYLAVPVISRSGEVIGGLFLGHEKAAVFSEREEKLVEGLAAQAAIAVDNARLFQKAQEAVRLRDEFLSIASHELKTPITPLKLQLQMARVNLRRHPENFSVDEFNRLIDFSLRQVDRMANLTESLLDVSRIQAGKLVLFCEGTNLVKLVREVAERLQDPAREKNELLKVQGPELIEISCDPLRIEQVMVNLISNAFKYGMGRPVQVTLNESEADAIIQVQDQGLGIARDKQSKIFERFERAISHNNISGLGLGLYIVRQIVIAHGGSVEVESELNKGSTFTVRIPKQKMVQNLEPRTAPHSV